MQRPEKTMKGQLNLVNIVGLIIGFMLYFYLFLPIYTPMANSAVAGLDPAWSTTPMTTALIYLVPLIVIIAMVLYIMNLVQGQTVAYG